MLRSAFRPALAGVLPPAVSGARPWSLGEGFALRFIADGSLREPLRRNGRLPLVDLAAPAPLRCCSGVFTCGSGAPAPT